MKLGKLRMGAGVDGPLLDWQDAGMEDGDWFYTDLPPLLKINKKTKEVMTYDFYISQYAGDFLLRGQISEIGKKLRVFESVAKQPPSKSLRQAAVEQLVSKWNKKHDKDGWVTDLSKPVGIQEPMLVHRWDKASAKKKEGPWLVGTKLDGLCSVYLPGGHKFFSRKRSEFKVPHLLDAMVNCSTVIGAHGELYKHGHSWEAISGAVSRGRDDSHDSEGRIITLQNSEVEFHMFDRHDMLREGYLTRLESLLDITFKSPFLHVIPSVYCETPEEVEEAMEGMLRLKFEGAVARKLDGMYEWNTRSWDVMKLKPLFSAEFLLHSITFDNDSVHGRMISYNCKMPDGQFFKATPSKSKAERAKDYEVLKMQPFDGDLWMTCEYRDVYANGKPKFAVAKGFRDDINLME